MLILVPTPLSDEASLDAETVAALKGALASNPLLIFEDPKVSRARWVKSGLPREVISQFEFLNTHTGDEELQKWIKALSKGQDAYLFSDGGLPAFCDPGRELIDLCHRRKVKVSCRSPQNSMSAALALSGFPIEPFRFMGFPPAKAEMLGRWIPPVLKDPQTQVFLETPYRAWGLLESLAKGAVKAGQGNRLVFLALELGRTSEALVRAPLKELESLVTEYREALPKPEIVIVLAPADYR